jgi:hypothetical protein
MIWRALLLPLLGLAFVVTVLIRAAVRVWVRRSVGRISFADRALAFGRAAKVRLAGFAASIAFRKGV